MKRLPGRRRDVSRGTSRPRRQPTMWAGWHYAHGRCAEKPECCPRRDNGGVAARLPSTASSPPFGDNSSILPLRRPWRPAPAKGGPGVAWEYGPGRNLGLRASVVSRSPGDSFFHGFWVAAASYVAKLGAKRATADLYVEVSFFSLLRVSQGGRHVQKHETSRSGS